MYLTYNAIGSQYAVTQPVFSWGGQGEVVCGNFQKIVTLNKH
ncbi:MAG TPA: hypothetical protein PK495_00915 [Bacteroidales bacterium]|nr:hypothetical protein [Bacteroidales bacterium]